MSKIQEECDLSMTGELSVNKARLIRSKLPKYHHVWNEFYVRILRKKSKDKTFNERIK